MIIELDGIPVTILRKPIKTIRLCIYPPDGLVKISVPLKVSEQLIRRTLEQKKHWIIQQQERIRGRSVAEDPALKTGASIPFLGKNYLLIIEEHHGPSQIKLNEELIHAYVPLNCSESQKQMILDRWYHQQMQSLLPDLIHHWEGIVGVKVADWVIKKMKSRWGSCNTRTGRICLNLNLIKKPQSCLEYVLVHELVHLWEPSHNKRFYRLMSQYMPEWQMHQEMLKGYML